MLLRNTMWQRGCERSQRFFRELSKNVTFIRTICHRKTLFLDPPKYLRKWDMDGHGLKNQVLVPMDPGGTKGSTPGRWDLPKPREKFPGPGSSTKEVTPQLQDTRACLNAPTRDTCRRPPLTCRSSALSQFPWKKAGQPFNPPSLGLYLGRPPPKKRLFLASTTNRLQPARSASDPGHEGTTQALDVSVDPAGGLPSKKVTIGRV